MKSALKRLLSTTGYSVVRTSILNDPQRQKQITRDDFFNLYFSKVNPAVFFFVQIGANDGHSNDPIHKYVVRYNLRGIAIEPQPDVFEELQATYAGTNVKCVNTAIGLGTPLTFYSVKSEFYGHRRSLMTGIASFDKANFGRSLAKKVTGDLSRYTKETVIPAPTFEEFAKDIDRIDFLQLDCEGFDWPILRTVDLEKWRPEIINFESMRLSDSDRADAESFLEGHGYRVFRYGIDTCAYRLK